jgi:hypothetical protein
MINLCPQITPKGGYEIVEWKNPGTQIPLQRSLRSSIMYFVNCTLIGGYYLLRIGSEIQERIYVVFRKQETNMSIYRQKSSIGV